MKIYMKKQTRQFIKGNFPGLTYQKRNFLRGNFLIPKLFLSLKENFIDCRLLKTYVLKAQLTVTCSKPIIKALEQVVNYVQS